MRKELELRITIPGDDDPKYVKTMIAKVLKAHAQYMDDLGHAWPSTCRYNEDEAVVWWALREVP